jgi:U3 small nucleolar RNA-associated protein 14
LDSDADNKIKKSDSDSESKSESESESESESDSELDIENLNNETGDIDRIINTNSNKSKTEYNINYMSKITTEKYIDELIFIFFNKYPHLEIKKNKEIINKLCLILIDKFPTKLDNKIFYINILESSIKEIIVPTLDNIINDD